MLRTVNNICTLILDEDVQGTITFWNEDFRDHYIKLRDDLEDASYSKNIDGIKKIFQSDYQGSKPMQMYLVGVAMINKFVNEVQKEDEFIVRNLKNSYLQAFESLDFDANFLKLLKIIL